MEDWHHSVTPPRNSLDTSDTTDGTGRSRLRYRATPPPPPRDDDRSTTTIAPDPREARSERDRDEPRAYAPLRRNGIKMVGTFTGYRLYGELGGRRRLGRAGGQGRPRESR